MSPPIVGAVAISMQGKVFISYARADHIFALQLGSDLRAAGVDVWLDQVDIEPGEPWDLAVEEALERSAAMVVVLTPSSAGSRSVLDEVSYALDTHKRVVPVLHQPCAIPLQIRRLHYTDFTVGYEPGLAQLAATLTGLRGGEPSAKRFPTDAHEPEPHRTVDRVPDETPPPINATTTDLTIPAASVTTNSPFTPGISINARSAGVALAFALVVFGGLFMWWQLSTQTTQTPAIQTTPAPTTPAQTTPAQTTPTQTINFRLVAHDDPRLSNCGGDPSCEKWSIHAKRLRNAVWTQVFVADPLMDNCMSYIPCVERLGLASRLGAVSDWTKLSYDNVLFEDCMGDENCNARNGYRGRLLAVRDWTNARFDSTFLDDCMDYAPCLTAATDVHRLKALDFTKVARTDARRQRCRGWKKCIEVFPSSPVGNGPIDCDVERLPACCKDAANPAACRTCKKRPDVDLVDDCSSG